MKLGHYFIGFAIAWIGLVTILFAAGLFLLTLIY